MCNVKMSPKSYYFKNLILYNTLLNLLSYKVKMFSVLFIVVYLQICPQRICQEGSIVKGKTFSEFLKV